MAISLVIAMMETNWPLIMHIISLQFAKFWIFEITSRFRKMAINFQTSGCLSCVACPNQLRIKYSIISLLWYLFRVLTRFQPCRTTKRQISCSSSTQHGELINANSKFVFILVQTIIYTYIAVQKFCVCWDGLTRRFPLHVHQWIDACTFPLLVEFNVCSDILGSPGALLYTVSSLSLSLSMDIWDSICAHSLVRSQVSFGLLIT